MDPDAVLKALAEALEANPVDQDMVFDLCVTLKTWLNRAGFEPAWWCYPQATQYFTSHQSQIAEYQLKVILQEQLRLQDRLAGSPFGDRDGFAEFLDRPVSEVTVAELELALKDLSRLLRS